MSYKNDDFIKQYFREISFCKEYEKVSKYGSFHRKLYYLYKFPSFIFYRLVYGSIGGVIEKLLNYIRWKYKYQISIVLMIKNEAQYLEEWIEYHKAIGISHFYIYDNESTDELKNVLYKYILDGTVQYIYYPGIGKQREIYTNAVRKKRLESKYLAFIDTDEFIVPLSSNMNITEIVESIFEKDIQAASIGVNWRMFGDSGYVERPKGLVSESFLHRAEDIWNGNNAQCIVKFICNPRLVFHFDEVGEPVYNSGCYGITENGERIYGAYSKTPSYKTLQINHYWTRSREEFFEKQSRGNSNTGIIGDKTWDLYEIYNRNEVYDDTILQKWKANTWYEIHKK
jgi:Domain of unknown function.